MIRKYSYMSILIVMIIVVYAIPTHAYTMADYWAFNEGNVWIYDRDSHVMGSQTHDFVNYTGKQFLFAREFCGGHPYIYSRPEGVLVVGFYSFEDNQWVDISATPIKLANKEMSIGDSVTSIVPAGIFQQNDSTSLTIKLEAVETVIVPAGTFNNALRLNLFIDEGINGAYTEKIWLAKGVGPVQIHRVSETNNWDGCFFSCSAWSCDDDSLEERYIKLNSFIKGKKGVVVIPLN